MIRDTITKIEAKLEQSSAVSPESRQELLDLLAKLKTEIGALAESDAQQAETIAGHTEFSTREAISTERNPELLQRSLNDLSASVEGFESSHPRLVEVVNRIAMTLSNLGI
jgi:ABC-type transporter Mla subunit MlaD